MIYLLRQAPFFNLTNAGGPSDEGLCTDTYFFVSFEIQKIPLYHADGKKKGLLTLGRDITDWRQVQEDLEERNLRLRSLIEYNADGIFELDLNGVFYQR